MYHQPSAPPGLGGLYMFQWNDDNCETKNNFICKYTAGIAAAVFQHSSTLKILEHCWPRFIFPTELPLDPSPSPNSTQTSKTHSVWLLKEMLPHMIRQTLWKVIVVSIQSEHYGCFSLQMSSLHLCCRGIQVTTTRTEVQVNRPNIPPTPQLWCCQTQMPTWQSLNLYLSVVHVSFSALNLVYIIIPTIPLILLLLTVTGVCCFKLLARRWGSKPKTNNKHKQRFYFTWIFPVITFQTVLRALIWSLLSRLCYDRVMCSKPKAAYCI